MTEWDPHYMNRNKSEPEPEHPLTDWGWYLAGASIAVLSLASVAAWIVEAFA